MAKRGEDNVLPEGNGVAETAPVLPVTVSSIPDEDSAKEFLKWFQLKGLLHVTSDCNVFEDIKPARNHASKQGLKIFSIQWD